ncbi:MAG: DUF2007 domain-containing protein [Myxococcales bacterium]|nr:DUF2007 domain-containing protein [Myxococcales bacterium]
MQLDETLAASRSMKGPLGAAAFVVLQGLRQAGAPPGEVDSIATILHRWLPALPSADADVLIQVLTRRVDEARESDAYAEMVRLGGRLTMVEAHILHDALNQQGLFSRLKHEHLSSADIPYPNTDVEVWVRAGDLDRAKAICEAVQTDDGAAPVACNHCNEENPAHFAYCWACGRAIDLPAEG